jgi:hypothetical protein
MAWLWGAPLAPIDAWSHQFEARPDDEPWKVHLIAVLLAARGRLRLARHDVITASELAALVGCDPATIARAIVSGKPMQGALLVRHAPDSSLPQASTLVPRERWCAGREI